MTVKEARVFLNVDSFDCIEDAHEQVVFEQKQYFLVKPCIPQLHNAKLEKLNRLSEAAQLLGLESEKDQFREMKLYFNETSMLTYYQSYMDQLVEIKKLLSRATTFAVLKSLVKVQLDLFLGYSSVWPSFSEFKDGLILGKEPDPVVFFGELKLLEREGITTFVGLIESSPSVGKFIKKESTRLNIIHASK